MVHRAGKHFSVLEMTIDKPSTDHLCGKKW